MRLFEPNHISFRVAYPELKEYESFNSLSDSEYAFIWHLGCKDSPIYGFDDKDKLVEAMKLVPDFSKKLSQEEYNKYIAGEFPEHIKAAIIQIGGFEPEIRYKAKVYTERYLEYANKVTSMSIEKYMGDDTISQLKVFMDLQTNIAAGLPRIVKNAEHGFGYTKKDKEKDSSDQYHVLENL